MKPVAKSALPQGDDARTMMRFSERFIEQGRQEGHKQEARRLIGKLIQRKFGEMSEWAEQRLTKADQVVLEDWTEALLSADSIENLLGQH